MYDVRGTDHAYSDDLGYVAVGWGDEDEIRDRRQLTAEVVPATYLHRPDELLVRPDAEARVAVELAALTANEASNWELSDRPGGTCRFTLRDRPQEPGLPPSRPVMSAVAKLRGFEPDLVAPNAIYCSAIQRFYSAPRYQGKGNRAQPVSAPPRLPQLEPQARRQVVVGVIDTGLADAQYRPRWLGDAVTSHQVRLDHSDLADLPDAILPVRVIDPVAGHGTFITGLLLQGAPKATVCAVREIDVLGVVSEAAVLSAIDRLAAVARDQLGRDLDILNLSLGGWSHGNIEPPFLARKLRELMARGTLVVAAAGNLATDRAFWPAAMKDVVAVSALDARRRVPSWSGRGSWVDVLARGVGLESTFYSGFTSHRRSRSVSFNGWARWSGTSFAAPRVAAAVADRMAQNDGLSAREAYEQLRRPHNRNGGHPVPQRQDFPNAWALD